MMKQATTQAVTTIGKAMDKTSSIGITITSLSFLFKFSLT